MPDLLMFVEDHAQERFLSALLRRMAAEHSVPTSIRVRTARGGFARVLRQLEDFARAVEGGSERLPDGLVVGLDANCRGYAERRRVVMDRARQLRDLVICAIPDPPYRALALAGRAGVSGGGGQRMPGSGREVREASVQAFAECGGSAGWGATVAGRRGVCGGHRRRV